VEKAKIGLIQFHLSPPKADIENTVVISDYAQVGVTGPCSPPHESVVQDILSSRWLVQVFHYMRGSL
jgi:hypothetical protein